MTENDEKKEFLWGYRKAIRKQKQIEDEIRQLRLDRISPSLVQDGMPHGSGGGDLSRYAVQLDSLLEELRKQGEECIRKRKEIIAKIEEIGNETEILLLRYRYINGMKWEDIAERMDICWRHVMRLHGKALAHLKI